MATLSDFESFACTCWSHFKASARVEKILDEEPWELSWKDALKPINNPVVSHLRINLAWGERHKLWSIWSSTHPLAGWKTGLGLSYLNIPTLYVYISNVKQKISISNRTQKKIYTYVYIYTYIHLLLCRTRDPLSLDSTRHSVRKPCQRPFCPSMSDPNPLPTCLGPSRNSAT